MAQINAFGPIEAAIDTLDEAWFKKHPDIATGQTGRAADMGMGGVLPEYHKCGIATQLARTSIDQARPAILCPRDEDLCDFDPIYKLIHDGLACVKLPSGVQYSLIFRTHVTDNKELSMNLSR